MKRVLYAFLCLPILVFAQKQQPDAAHIKLNLKRLNFLGSALYVAAHPDDENTRVITYLVGERLATTAYLSMTRGDGGQNLIGSEMRELLGLIRTQELIAARKIDGGRQFFTRAIDFGYSKSADETFRIWNKDEILSDVVRIYRKFQPDVVMTRFPPDERAGHGHHTASAMLAQEAYELSGKATSYADQLSQLPVWQPKRVYTNTGRFFSATIDENTPGVTTLNVGGYNPLLGASYSEIAAESRSQHKSQGFGAASRRGDAPEYFELAKGEPATKDIFDGVNTTWSRVSGGEKIQPLVERVIREFDVEKPERSIPVLLQIRKAIMTLEPGVWKSRKLEETNQLIKDCLGLYAEVAAATYWASPGQKMTFTLELINRSGIDVTICQLTAPDLKFDSTFTRVLHNNDPLLVKTTRVIREDIPYSDPYWLKDSHSAGIFTVADHNLIGKPENDPAISFEIMVTIAGEMLPIAVPVVYKQTDPVKGEIYRPFEIVPVVFLNLADQVLLFKDDSPKQVKVLVKSSTENVTGNLSLSVPDGWRTEPSSVPVAMTRRGEEQTILFTVYPSSSEMTGIVTAMFASEGKVYSHALHTIQYDHIPVQTLLPKAQAKMVRLNLKKEGNTIGYINGAGDDVPVALRNMGYEVWEMKNEEVTPANLLKVDAVVLGVRAFNTNERLRFLMADLVWYVENGGVLVVQYNTTLDLGKLYTPYRLQLSRDRVSEEDAEVRILKPDHRVMSYPNTITEKDFDGWVQERGLYFPNSWDEKFEAILSMNDTGETPKDGSLLVANYGKGYYVYTGLSFFRELPEGVPGAYKLFANLVSLGKPITPVPATVSKKKRPK